MSTEEYDSEITLKVFVFRPQVILELYRPAELSFGEKWTKISADSGTINVEQNSISSRCHCEEIMRKVTSGNWWPINTRRRSTRGSNYSSPDDQPTPWIFYREVCNVVSRGKVTYGYENRDLETTDSYVLPHVKFILFWLYVAKWVVGQEKEQLLAEV